SVRTDQHGALGRYAPSTGPRKTRIEEVAVEVTDTHCIHCDACGPGGFLGRVAPRLTTLSRDQQETVHSDQILNGPTNSSLVVDPGVRQRAAGTRPRFVNPDVIDALRFGRSVRRHRRR